MRLVEDLNGHDFRRVVVPLGELGFLKSGSFDLLSISIIVDLKLDMGASGDLHLRPDSFHGASKRKTFHKGRGIGCGSASMFRMS
jgi:hypothetical protein